MTEARSQGRGRDKLLLQRTEENGAGKGFQKVVCWVEKKVAETACWN
jgi:hypothetical protein